MFDEIKAYLTETLPVIRKGGTMMPVQIAWCEHLVKMVEGITEAAAECPPFDDVCPGDKVSSCAECWIAWADEQAGEKKDD